MDGTNVDLDLDLDLALALDLIFKFIMELVSLSLLEHVWQLASSRVNDSGPSHLQVSLV